MVSIRIISFYTVLFSQSIAKVESPLTKNAHAQKRYTGGRYNRMRRHRHRRLHRRRRKKIIKEKQDQRQNYGILYILTLLSFLGTFFGIKTCTRRAVARS